MIKNISRGAMTVINVGEPSKSAQPKGKRVKPKSIGWRIQPKIPVVTSLFVSIRGISPTLPFVNSFPPFAAARNARTRRKNPVKAVKIIKKAGTSINRINEIKVNLGPGSFTGLRVGVAVANALGWALKIPVNGKRITKGEVVIPKYD